MADIIDTLLALDDAALAKKLGFADKVASFKADLAAAAKLNGEGRASVADSLNKMFVPQTYAIEDLGWKVEREQKKAKKLEAGTDDMLASCNVCDACAPSCD